MNPQNKISINPGDRFNKWTVIEELDPKIVYGKRKAIKRMILCVCDCGNIQKIQLSGLVGGHTKSCGCMLKEAGMKRRKEYPKGMRFGKLVIIKEVDPRKLDRCFLCQCDCDKEVISRLSALKRKGGSSCGCTRRKPMIKNRSENYPYTNHRLYSIWGDMKKRCYNKNSRAYKWYGDRGIRICQDWLDRFLNFYNWAIANGYSDDLTIERLNPTKNYDPLNCTWIPWSEQNNNKGNSRFIIYKGVNMTVGQAAKIYGIDYHTLIGRLNREWSVSDAIEIKPSKIRRYAL